MLRGRVPINRMGIGSMNLAASGRDTEKLKGDQWGFFLQAFSQIYDVVVDIEMLSPLKIATLDMADAIVWTLTPNALALRATLQQLEILQSQKYGFHKFCFVLNQANAPHSLPADAVNEALGRFGKELQGQLSVEPELLRLLNQGRPAIIEGGRSEY